MPRTPRLREEVSGKPKGALDSEIRSATYVLEQRPPRANGVPPLYREWVALSTGARFPS